MISNVEHYMSIIVDSHMEAVSQINNFAGKYGLQKIKTEELLKPTTSESIEKGSFPHMEWMVTSYGVVQGMVSALRFLMNRDLTDVPERLSRFVKGLGLDPNDISVLIPGFGDVGSGEAKLLVGKEGYQDRPDYKDMPEFSDLETYGSLAIKVRGTSNIRGALYCRQGLSAKGICQMRELVEKTDDVDNVWLVEEWVKAGYPVDKVWLPVENPSLSTEDKERYARLIDLIRDKYPETEIITGGLEVLDLMMEEEATILMPSAGSRMIRTKDQVARLKVKIVAEGANNAISPELEKLLYEAGLLYLPGELLNGGGIYCSKEEIRHFASEIKSILEIKNQRERENSLNETMEQFRYHVVDGIKELIIARMRYVMYKWFEDRNWAYGELAENVPDIVRNLAKDILELVDRLLTNDETLQKEFGYDVLAQLRQRADFDYERNAHKVPYRHVLLEAAVELAGEIFVYAPGEYAGDAGYLLNNIQNEELKKKQDQPWGEALDRRRMAIYRIGKIGETRAAAVKKVTVQTLTAILNDKTENLEIRKNAAEALSSLIGYLNGRQIEDYESLAVKALQDRSVDDAQPQQLKVWSKWALNRIGIPPAAAQAAGTLDTLKQIAALLEAQKKGFCMPFTHQQFLELSQLMPELLLGRMIEDITLLTPDEEAMAVDIIRSCQTYLTNTGQRTTTFDIGYEPIAIRVIGNRLLTVSPDHKLHLWDLAKGKQLKEYFSVVGFSVVPSYFAIITNDKDKPGWFILYNAESGADIYSSPLGAAHIASLASHSIDEISVLIHGWQFFKPENELTNLEKAAMQALPVNAKSIKFIVKIEPSGKVTAVTVAAANAAGTILEKLKEIAKIIDDSEALSNDKIGTWRQKTEWIQRSRLIGNLEKILQGRSLSSILDLNQQEETKAMWAIADYYRHQYFLDAQTANSFASRINKVPVELQQRIKKLILDFIIQSKDEDDSDVSLLLRASELAKSFPLDASADIVRAKLIELYDEMVVDTDRAGEQTPGGYKTWIYLGCYQEILEDVAKIDFLARGMAIKDLAKRILIIGDDEITPQIKNILMDRYGYTDWNGQLGIDVRQNIDDAELRRIWDQYDIIIRKNPAGAYTLTSTGHEIKLLGVDIEEINIRLQYELESWL